MRLSILFEAIEPKSDPGRFPYAHGPFNSKNNVYMWFKRMIGDRASLYFGNGPQSNVLKGHGGGQEAWFGYIKRTPDGVYFYGKQEYPFEPEIKTDESVIDNTPMSLSDVQKMIQSGSAEDEILAASLERGITRKFAGILKYPGTPEYKSIDETLAMMLADQHDIKQIYEGEPEEPESPINIGRYGVDMDDFAASVLSDKSDMELADLFHITPAQAKSLRLSTGYKRRQGASRMFSREDIENLYELGLSDREISDKLELSTGRKPSIAVVAEVTRPLRVERVEQMHAAKIKPFEIAHKLGMEPKIVSRIINQYDERMRGMSWCKKHGCSYNPNFGCVKCKQESSI